MPCETVESPYNSKSCLCCGRRGYRQGRRFRCTNDSCAVQQDHADRNDVERKASTARRPE
nr:zinc ribbon domain-containing protein [Haladaptatus sp. W1]